MKPRSYWLGLAAGAALLSGAPGCGRQGGEPSASVSTAPAAADRVMVGKPQRKSLVLNTTQPARIEAFEETPLYAKLAAFVKEVHVDIGDPVSSGQTLVTLGIPELVDEADQKAALLAQAEAEASQAASNVEAVEAAADTAKAKIAEARAGITRATGEYERWRAEYARIKKLAESASVTEKMADETLNQFRAAEGAREEADAAVKSAEASSHEAQANIKKAEADEVAAQARLKVAAADLARAKTMLGYAEIKAPFDGVVTQRSIDTGHFVQPAGGTGAKPLLTIARIDKVRVFMDIPEMDAARVDVGDESTVLVQALGGKQLKAPVARTSWSLDQSNRSLRAEIDVVNEGSALRPGMYAVGTIQLERRENVLVLPVTAIVRDGAETYCCIVQSSKVDRRRVLLGLRSGAEIEVLDGLADDSEVVLTKADSLQHGQSVDLVKAPK